MTQQDAAAELGGVSQLNEAMAEAQERARIVVKDGDDPRYGKNTLASTENILLVVKEANKGLGLSFRPKKCPITRGPDGLPCGITRVLSICHASGEEVEVETDWPVVLKTNKDGKASQTWDDAIATAQTRSLGYLLRDAWGLPRLAQEDIPPGADGPVAEAAAPAPDDWKMLRDEWNAAARKAIQSGVARPTIIAAVRQLGGLIGDDGVWTGRPEAAAEGKISAYLRSLAPAERSPQQPAATSAPASTAPTAASPSRPATTTAPSTTSTTSASTAAAAPPSTAPTPATPTTTPAAPSPSDAVSREKLDQLSAACGSAIKMYAVQKKDLAALLRTWAKRDVVSDEGRFTSAVTPAEWTAMRDGFKAWEVERSRQQPRAKTPEELAEEARLEWEASAPAPQ